MDGAARGARAVDAWCDAMGVGPDRSAATLWECGWNRMPPPLLRIVGEQLSPAERGRVPQVRERRRHYAEMEAPYELSAAVQRAKHPLLWKEIVADEEGEQDDDQVLKQVAPPSPAADPRGELGLFTLQGPAAQLHRTYLAAIDDAEVVPIAPDTPAHLLAAFQREVVARFVVGQLDEPLYACDYEERYDAPRTFCAQADEEAWFDDEGYEARYADPS
ncbi:hypothetical protein MNAN1_001251 [Malassezia nana]|uniref:CCD97-like C-terminal domain-containing protein n=1 Tax=Malassezia nana TaxID=180528 RepID=A0AAF0J1U2_9BASI|nr:hypothetical protein MNAN1_001251 [Malassezia nana]